jgi:hypothetical protein
MISDLLLGVLRHVWNTLEPEGVPCALMGGIALSVWDHVRATRDVDLLIDLEGADQEKLYKAISAAGIRFKRDPPIMHVEGLQVIQLLYEPPGAFMQFQVDLHLATTPFHRQVLSRRVSLSLPELDLNVDVVTCEDLILLKLIAGRVIDRADAAFLLRNNQQTLDLEFVRTWVTQFNLQKQFSEIWDEAFPNSASS